MASGYTWAEENSSSIFGNFLGSLTRRSRKSLTFVGQVPITFTGPSSMSTYPSNQSNIQRSSLSILTRREQAPSNYALQPTRPAFVARRLWRLWRLVSRESHAQG